MVKVTVLDANDNSPVITFNDQVKALDITAQTDFIVADVKITDSDSGDNAKV